MPKLEQICEQMEMKTAGTRGEDSISRHFRLWLTSYPSNVFPSTVLQSGIKMTNEPSFTLKSNMKGSFKSDPLSNDEFMSGVDKPQVFKKIAFGLTMFHAIILQRRSFGPLGWNIRYKFTQSDLEISLRQLRYFINEYDSVQFNALNYIIGVCNYGGRVTEELDQRVLMALLEDFLSPNVLNKNYRYGGGNENASYLFPEGDRSLDQYL